MSTDTKTPPPASPGVAESAKLIPPIANAEARLRAIAEQQGTLGKATFENLFGAGSHLWASEEEFDRFLQLTGESRGKE